MISYCYNVIFFHLHQRYITVKAKKLTFFIYFERRIFMKDTYISPDMDVVRFNTEDIITTSLQYDTNAKHELPLL